MANQSNLDWQYLNNQIANALADSYSDTNIFTTDHLSKLRNMAGDADIDRLVVRTEAAYADFQAAYTTWQKSTAYWKGATSRVDTALDAMLTAKIPRWDILVQVEYEQGSAEYMTIFPNGRTAFRDVGKDSKIQLLGTLASILGDYPLLAAVQADASVYYTNVSGLRDAQQQREQNVRDSSTNLRETQTELFTILYQNLGALIDKYGRRLEEILNFFDVAMIRTTGRKRIADETAKIAAADAPEIDAAPVT